MNQNKPLILEKHEIDVLMDTFCSPGVLEEFIEKHGVDCFIEDRTRFYGVKTILSFAVMYSTVIRKIDYSLIVKKLVEAGADVNLRNYGLRGTALHAWAYESRTLSPSHVVGRILLSAGANTQIRSYTGYFGYISETCMEALLSILTEENEENEQKIKIMIEGGALDDVSRLLGIFCEEFRAKYRTKVNIVQLVFRIDLIIENMI